MKRTKKIKIFVIFGLLFCLSGLAQATDWTFMVYLDGDNNLEEYAIDDFLEMASVSSSSDVKIVVLLDRIGGDDDRYGNWTNARRGIVNKDDEPDTSWGTSMGELNMGDPQTLIDFVEWGMQNHPASKYAVVLWNHGSGWRKRLEEEPIVFKSVCVDDTSNDRLFMREVRSALDTIETDEQEPDLVGFDACLMAMVEVAYEIREHADVMVGSEATEPGSGWPYDTILQDLVYNPSMSAVGLANTIIWRYYKSQGDDETQSATHLWWMNLLATRIDSLAQTLRDEWNGDTAGCSIAAGAVMMAVKSAVWYEEHGPSYPGSEGLAIYFPETIGEFNAQYNDTTILFAADTRWEEFLQDFYSSMTGSWVAVARDDSQEYDANGNDPGGLWHIDLHDFCSELTSNVIWVEFDYPGPWQYGSFYLPFNTLAEALVAAPSGGTVGIKAGSSSETMTISKEVTLRACGGTVTIGQ